MPGLDHPQLQLLLLLLLPQTLAAVVWKGQQRAALLA
jgi:hypothetical protein